MATKKRTPHQQADVFRKTRADHSNEIAEDYVEAIAELHAEEGSCRVTRLARRLGVSHVTANRTVARLVGRDLVTTSPYQPIELTEAGKALAQTAKARHEIVLRFLIELGVPERHGECRFRGNRTPLFTPHTQSDETLLYDQETMTCPGRKDTPALRCHHS